MNTKEYKDFILERMDLPILAKSMMGGYLFYYENLSVFILMSSFLLSKSSEF